MVRLGWFTGRGMRDRATSLVEVNGQGWGARAGLLAGACGDREGSLVVEWGIFQTLIPHMPVLLQISGSKH